MNSNMQDSLTTATERTLERLLTSPVWVRYSESCEDLATFSFPLHAREASELACQMHQAGACPLDQVFYLSVDLARCKSKQDAMAVARKLDYFTFPQNAYAQ